MPKQTKINKQSNINIVPSDAEIAVEHEAKLNIKNIELYQRMLHTDKMLTQIMSKHNTYAIWIFTSCVIVAILGIVLALLNLH